MVTSWKSTSAAMLLLAILSACGTAGGELPEVHRVALQDDIAARLTAAGEPPRSVACHDDLVGEPGRTVRCDVVLSDTNSFQPIVTVTSVVRGTVEYQLAPAVSQAQLEYAVRRLAADAGEPVAAVACVSGLEGAVGARAYCDVDAGAGPSRRTVEVTEVAGLTMNFNLLSS